MAADRSGIDFVQPLSSDHEHVDKISAQTTAIVLAVFALIAYEIQWILLPFVVAGLLAYICTPLIGWLSNRCRVPRPLAAIGTFLALLSLAASIGFFGVPPLVDQLVRSITDLQGTIDALAKQAIGDGGVNLFGLRMDADELAQTIVTNIRDWLGQAGRLAALGGIAFATMFGVLLTVVLLFYFLLSGPSILRNALWLVPPKQRPLIEHIWRRVDPVLRRYFIGVIVVVTYAVVAAYLGLGIVLGIPHAPFLALLTGILEMIPMLGPGAAAVIAGMVAVRYAKGIEPIIGYAIYATALRLSIDQLIGPIALGAAGRVHPVLIIFCFLAGGLLFGVAGVIVAVPIALITKFTLATLYDEPLNTDGTK